MEVAIRLTSRLNKTLQNGYKRFHVRIGNNRESPDKFGIVNQSRKSNLLQNFVNKFYNSQIFKCNKTENAYIGLHS